MLPLLLLLGVGAKVAVDMKVSAAIIKLATMSYITDYVKNKDIYKSATKYRIEEILKSKNYNTVKIGIYDNSDYLLANEDINCEGIDDSVRVGQEIYI
ncbi:hypothetical protein EPJ69_00390 [Brachyspira aalborgi]|uniref:Uncharacterized protein n=1 Tax=Brachyspira aalborgi TaxID=29522 RepID=A0A5C8ELS0_9SPIR|nr:hypothetical protein [Brachyspira aalborgi]TXJ35034.1 hypothetical protein EPJ69_00390 [Brachyspira aalborgi]TXJ37682.1 hypothetical protein EPJ78_02910 [Brachyspira aalborgi]